MLSQALLCLLVVLALADLDGPKVGPTDGTDDILLHQEITLAREQELKDVSEQYINDHQKTIRDETKLLAVAYGLNEAQYSAVWHGLFHLLAQQYIADKEFTKPFSSDATESEINGRLQKYITSMPMKPSNMCSVVEKILGPGNYVVQRQIFDELRNRRQRIVEAIDDEVGRIATFNTWLPKAREDRTSFLSERMKPIPQIEALRLRRLARENSDAQGASEKAQEQLEESRAMVYPGHSVLRRPEVLARLTIKGGPSSASSGDNFRIIWDEALANCVAKVDDPQRRSIAERLAADLWKRVEAYRQSRQGDYEAIDGIASKRKYLDARATLEEPVQALLTEFRERLATICGT